MFSESAAELYDIVPIGTTVVISKGPYGSYGKSTRIIIPGNRGSDILQVQRTLKKFLKCPGGYLLIATGKPCIVIFMLENHKNILIIKGGD